jgi:hypothetical protein
MSFKFTPNEKIIEIEGEKYIIQPGDIENDGNIMKLMAEITSLLLIPGNDVNKEDPLHMRRLCSLIGNEIDLRLGEGSYQKIFSKRRVNFIDHLNLILYIREETELFTKDRLSRALGIVEKPKIKREIAPPEPSAEGNNDT